MSPPGAVDPVVGRTTPELGGHTVIVEDALLDLGNRPLRKSSFSMVIVAVVNSYLTRYQIDEVDIDTPADVTLSRIYQLDQTTQRDVLDRKVGVVRDRDTYRMTLMYASGIIAMIVVVIAIIEIMNVGTDKSGISLALLGKIIEGGFELLTLLVP